MSAAKLSVDWLWPTPVMFAEFSGPEVAQHNLELERIVIRGCDQQSGLHDELRLHELGQVESDCVAWLMTQIKESSAAYCGFASAEGIEVSLRGVVLRTFGHINSHTEGRESDLGVAYWPSGDPNMVGQVVNQNADGVHAPTFTLEDPSRSLSDLRLPMEMRHSVDVCPRPGLMALFPAHLPHNVQPFKGSKPFVHIVAQVRMPWPKDYFRRNL